MEVLSFQNIILLFAFLLNIGLGILVLLKNTPYKRVNISFSIFSWACAIWVCSILMIYLFRDLPWRLYWVRMSFFGSSIIPAAFFYFSLIFPKEKRNVSWPITFLIAILSLAFAFISFTKLMIISVHWGTLSSNFGVAHNFFSIYFIIFMLGGIFSLIKSFKNSVGLERIQIKYCFLGIFLTFIPAITSNLILPSLGTSRFSHLGPSSTLIMISFFTYAILKHRLMDINIVLKKGTTYIFLLLLLFVPSILLILLNQKIFFGKIDYLFSLVAFSILLLTAIFFDRIRPGTEKVVEQILFKNRYDYRETLGTFSKAMVTILNLQSLSKRIIETITQTMGVEKASLFLLNEEKGAYSLFESINIKKTTAIHLLSKNDPLPHYLQKIGEIIIKEELAKGANLQELNDVINKMSLIEAEVSIPLISKGQLIGMINLSHKFNKDIYFHEDIELLSTLANQTAIAIENAKLYEDLKRSKSYMRRADRLASLGTLTAGLAHEIRNPLVAIKTLTQLLPERLDDVEFRDQFLKIASGEVDRISSLVTELLEFARPSDPKLESEDINAVLDGMILLVSTETKKKQISITKEYSSELPPIQIDREQIKQVFLNILLNAIEATSENGKIIVKTRSFTKPGGEPYIQIEFTDTGYGIPEEYLEEIFNPFFTTKSTGSGLGLSISNQIIQDHRGYINVESQQHKGTSFFINLPVNQQSSKRRKEDLEKSQNISTIFEGR
jgi:signal transduction histidine kinase/MFS family permease